MSEVAVLTSAAQLSNTLGSNGDVFISIEIPLRRPGLITTPEYLIREVNPDNEFTETSKLSFRIQFKSCFFAGKRFQDLPDFQ